MDSLQEERLNALLKSLIESANSARTRFSHGSISDTVRFLREVRQKAEHLELLLHAPDHDRGRDFVQTTGRHPDPARPGYFSPEQQDQSARSRSNAQAYSQHQSPAPFSRPPVTRRPSFASSHSPGQPDGSAQNSRHQQGGDSFSPYPVQDPRLYHDSPATPRGPDPHPRQPLGYYEANAPPVMDGGRRSPLDHRLPQHSFSRGDPRYASPTGDHHTSAHSSNPAQPYSNAQPHRGSLGALASDPTHPVHRHRQSSLPQVLDHSRPYAPDSQAGFQFPAHRTPPVSTMTASGGHRSHYTGVNGEISSGPRSPDIGIRPQTQPTKMQEGPYPGQSSHVSNTSMTMQATSAPLHHPDLSNYHTRQQHQQHQQQQQPPPPPPPQPQAHPQQPPSGYDGPYGQHPNARSFSPPAFHSYPLSPRAEKRGIQDVVMQSAPPNQHSRGSANYPSNRLATTMQQSKISEMSHSMAMEDARPKLAMGGQGMGSGGMGPGTLGSIMHPPGPGSGPGLGLETGPGVASFGGGGGMMPSPTVAGTITNIHTNFRSPSPSSPALASPVSASNLPSGYSYFRAPPSFHSQGGRTGTMAAPTAIAPSTGRMGAEHGGTGPGGAGMGGNGGNSTTRTQHHAPLEPEVVKRLDELFFKFLQRICSDLSAYDSKGDPIHQPLMAKKMQRLEASTDFRPFKFRIQAFTNAFHESLVRQGLTEDILPLRKVKVYLWKHKYISRFNEDGKKQKSKGNHVWNIEARKIPDGETNNSNNNHNNNNNNNNNSSSSGSSSSNSNNHSSASTTSSGSSGGGYQQSNSSTTASSSPSFAFASASASTALIKTNTSFGETTSVSDITAGMEQLPPGSKPPIRWEFREYTSRIAGQIIKFARVGILYVYTPRIWDAQMACPRAEYSSPWLPSWLKWAKGELRGTPGPEDESCTITVVAEYMREDERCRLEMSFHLTVSDPSKEGELMDSQDEDEDDDQDQLDEDDENDVRGMGRGPGGAGAGMGIGAELDGAESSAGEGDEDLEDEIDAEEGLDHIVGASGGPMRSRRSIARMVDIQESKRRKQK